LEAFIKSLRLLPASEIAKKFKSMPNLPLVFQKATGDSLIALLERLQPQNLLTRDKDHHPFIATAAPTGSGKVGSIPFAKFLC
jgi:hypothetical protein